MKIGHFSKTEDGVFEGRIETLTITAAIRLLLVNDKPSEKAPDFRIVSADSEAEIGAGWHEMSRNNKPYISVKIDDPAFAYPIWAALTRDDSGEFSLYWDRPKSKAETPAQKETL